MLTFSIKETNSKQAARWSRGCLSVLIVCSHALRHSVSANGNRLACPPWCLQWLYRCSWPWLVLLTQAWLSASLELDLLAADVIQMTTAFLLSDLLLLLLFSCSVSVCVWPQCILLVLLLSETGTNTAWQMLIMRLRRAREFIDSALLIPFGCAMWWHDL